MLEERRLHPRVKLRQPMRGVVGPVRVYVIDASVSGVRVAHQANLPDPGEFCRVQVPTDLGEIKLDCEVVRTVPDKALYLTGLHIVAADRQSTERLRSVFDSELNRS